VHAAHVLYQEKVFESNMVARTATIETHADAKLVDATDGGEPGDVFEVPELTEVLDVSLRRRRGCSAVPGRDGGCCLEEEGVKGRLLVRVKAVDGLGEDLDWPINEVEL